MNVQKLEKAHKKISSVKQKLGGIGFQSVEFYHQANLGDKEINLSALILPSAVSAAGFANPSPSAMTAANLRSNRANFSLYSYRGKWFDRIDYTINSNGKISLIQATDEAEIFHGVIHNIVRNQTENIDLQSLIAVGTLAAGQTDFNTGKAFRANANPLYQMGEVIVYRGNTPTIMLRNVGNATASVIADGNYEEVNLDGWSSTIRFNDAGAVGGELVIVMSTGRLLERPSTSLLQEIESLAGQLDVIRPYVESLAGLPANTLKALPNNVDLKAFGDKLVNLDKRFDTTQNLSVYTKTKWQKKTLTSTINTNGAVVSEFAYNNLVIGKSYQLRCHAIFSLPPSGFTDASVNFNHNSSSVLSLRANATQTGNTHAFTFGDSNIFVATATTITASFANNLGGAIATGSYAILEELPNHEVTTQWT